MVLYEWLRVVHSVCGFICGDGRVNVCRFYGDVLYMPLAVHVLVPHSFIHELAGVCIGCGWREGREGRECGSRVGLLHCVEL